MKIPHGAIALLVLASSLGAASPASAVSRTCGSDLVANTANVLCAPPSGPCTPTSVTMSANIEVVSGRCKFDLGGRSLTVQKTFQMVGAPGGIEVWNANDITLTSTGKLKSRGDFVQPDGFIIAGGDIILDADGSLTHSGVMDVSGDPAGAVLIGTGGGVALQRGSLVQGDGITSFVDAGQRFTDGGDLDIDTDGGVTVDGDVSMRGANGGEGGYVTILSAFDIVIDRKIDASGGASAGGVIVIGSGDSVFVRAPLDVQSRSGGGFGGEILIEGALSEGAAPGGSVMVEGATLNASGSSGDGFGGDGGGVDLFTTAGSVTVTGSAAIRVNAGTQFDGFGGMVIIETGDADLAEIAPLDGDVTMEVPIHASSGNTGGEGGFVVLDAGRDLLAAASSTLTGRTGGGDFYAQAGRALTLQGAIAANATSANGEPGTVELIAGLAALGSLTVGADVVAHGGSKSDGSELMTIAGCSVVVEPNVKIDGHAGVGPLPGGAIIEIISRGSMLLGAGSQFLAYPAGEVRTVHPPGQPPTIGNGVVFNPPRVDAPTAGSFPACGGL